MTETVTIRDRIFERCPECKRLTKAVRCRYCGKQCKSVRSLWLHEKHCPSNPVGLCKFSKKPYSECTEENEWGNECVYRHYVDEAPGSFSHCRDAEKELPFCERWRRDNWLMGGYKGSGDPHDNTDYFIAAMELEIRATMTPDAVKPPWWEEEAP